MSAYFKIIFKLRGEKKLLVNMFFLPVLLLSPFNDDDLTTLLYRLHLKLCFLTVFRQTA